MTHRLRLYVKLLLYPVIMRVFARPERGVLGISIGYLKSKTTLLLLSLVGDCKRYTEYHWFFYSENSREQVIDSF